jgi:hypothetical protein
MRVGFAWACALIGPSQPLIVPIITPPRTLANAKSRQVLTTEQGPLRAKELHASDLAFPGDLMFLGAVVDF